jgi:hypothetical protein
VTLPAGGSGSRVGLEQSNGPRRSLFLIYKCSRQRPNARKNLNRELIPVTEILLRREAMSHTRWGIGQNDCAWLQSRTLREEARDLGDGEYQVAVFRVNIRLVVVGRE